MSGQDVFFGCLGIASIIVALATARAIPEMLKMVERITMADPKYRQGPQRSGEFIPGAPWGRRPGDGDSR